ncbi:hypothetical protein B0H19DRAFT_1175732 [Mycena capillaripes]|nr:hypothetical protein B0H19DRAFT_1175732 [Mycena capillaripes]
MEICKVIYLDYQSRVNWRSACDIVRSNPKFHGAPRFDSVIYKTDGDAVGFGQLRLVFHCHLPGSLKLDLAMICPFNTTNWQPKTRTDCPIRQQVAAQSCIFVALEHIERGALLCPIFGVHADMHYILDCIDEDMYLCVNSN